MSKNTLAFMPGDPFVPINGDGPDAQAHSTPSEPAEPAADLASSSAGLAGPQYSVPSGGHIFEDGFEIPHSLSGALGKPLEEKELEDAYDEVAPDFGGPGMAGALHKYPGESTADIPQIPPADPATFCCMVGPCQHYIELVLGVLKDDPEDPFDRPDLWRVCMKMHDREGEISLKDANVPLCSGYRPPRFSLRGQLQRRRVRYQLDLIGRRRPRRGDALLMRLPLVAQQARLGGERLKTAVRTLVWGAAAGKDGGR